MPKEVDWPAEERGCKWNTVGAGSIVGLEIVLTLLAKLVTIYMGFFIVKVEKTSFKKTFLRPSIGSATSLSIHKDFYELVKVHIGVFGQCGSRRRCECKSRCGRGSTKVGERRSR